MIEQKDLTGASLAERVARLVADRGRLQAMSAAARRFARPDAARAIVDRVFELVEAA
jgi:UDP-N-acetylglucosamine:LPS N-acetylglucosamine transferase